MYLCPHCKEYPMQHKLLLQHAIHWNITKIKCSAKDSSPSPPSREPSLQDDSSLINLELLCVNFYAGRLGPQSCDIWSISDISPREKRCTHRRNIERRDIWWRFGMSQANRPAWSLSLLTIGGQWVCGWSKVSTDQKMPGLPVRGDTYGDETSCYNFAHRRYEQV